MGLVLDSSVLIIAEREATMTYLGKAVRWYYSMARGGYIGYAKTGNLVATSEGAMPAMQMPKQIPGDIDYQRYIDEAHNMLTDLGLRVSYDRSVYA